MTVHDSSEKCKELLAAVKALVGTDDKQLAICDDACLRRYLRARQGDIKKAAKMLHNTLLWRKEFRIETLDKSEFEAETRTGKMYVLGTDKRGHSLLVTRKKSEAFQAGQYDQYLRHLVFSLETTVRAMKQGQESWVWIMDMNGYSRQNSPPLNVSLATLHILADHYPERLHRCYMVDAPAIFSWLFSAISPFLDPVTKAKIVFINSKDYMKPTAGPGGAGTAGSEEAGPAGEETDDFSHYLSYYNEPYNEEKYRALLSEVGW